MALPKTVRVGIIILVPALIALLFPYRMLLPLFPDNGDPGTIAVMTIVPFLVGVASIALSTHEMVYKISYRFFMPWLSIVTFFIMAALLRLEDCSCWLLGLPLYLILSGLGGLAAGYFKNIKRNAATQKEDTVS